MKYMNIFYGKIIYYNEIKYDIIYKYYKHTIIFFYYLAACA